MSATVVIVDGTTVVIGIVIAEEAAEVVVVMLAVIVGNTAAMAMLPGNAGIVIAEKVTVVSVLVDVIPDEITMATVTTSTDSGFTAVTGASQYLIMTKHMSKELAEPMNIHWKTSSIHMFENG